MSESESGPQSPPLHYRIANLKSFLPLSEESSLSTRGQHLPQIIQSRSSSNLTDLRKTTLRRRRSSFGEDLSRRTTESRYPDRHDLEAGGRRASNFPWPSSDDGNDDWFDERRMSVLMTPQMRSQRLIGNSNPRYKWEQYYKSEEQLKGMKKPIRKYYERCNSLVQHYMYIDRLLDSSLPHTLIQEYHGSGDPQVPATITEEATPGSSPVIVPNEQSKSNITSPQTVSGGANTPVNGAPPKVNRTKDLYRLKADDENTPLMYSNNDGADEDDDVEEQPMPPGFEPEEDVGSNSRVVTVAIYLNLVANAVLLILKIVVVALSSSVSVLASLVDAALDFLSTAIVWTTTYLIARNDQYSYPIGRRRLEPIGVLVFSVIMITSFIQVALEGFQKMSGSDHEIVKLTTSAIAIMAATVVIKFFCWLWCRLINNSSVQALAQDAMTDVVFNIFSIIFPLVGFYARVWWLDPLGGILLSLWVIGNWSRTTSTHIRNLTGAAASADERNILLYLTMRFAKTIRQIQGLQAYHSGDKLNVEVDIVLDENTSLRDSHDLGESLQYVLESVPTVDRAFVHLDYAGYNLPTHMRQG